MAVSINQAEQRELLCKVVLTKEKFPIAFANKVKELIMEGAATTMEEAEKLASEMEIELELYYEVGYGLFAVESEAIECGFIRSPYSGEMMAENVSREEMISYIERRVDEEGGKIGLGDNDVIEIYDGDTEEKCGEAFEVIMISTDIDGFYGCEMSNEDFFKLMELSDYELRLVYDYLKEHE